MLVLHRRKGESIQIGKDILVKVLEAGGQVVIGIEAPQNIKILRTELIESDEADSQPDWDTPCEVCGEVPTLPATAMCGPCTFGDSDTIGGNW